MTTADHGARLSRAEAEIAALREGQEVIFKKLDSQGSKMDAVIAAVHELRGTTGPSWGSIMTAIRDAAVVFSLVVGGILYLANATIRAGSSDLETRLARLEVIIGLATANAKRGGGVSWVPEAGIGELR